MTTRSLKDLYNSFEQDEIHVLPAGTHRLEVVGCSVHKNGHGVTPVYRAVSGPYAGKKVMAGTQSLTENSAFIFFPTMKGFGLDKAYFDREPSFDQIAKDLVGRIVDVELAVEPYKGEDRNKIVPRAVKLVGTKDDAGIVHENSEAAPAAPAAPAPTPAGAPAPPQPEAAPAAPPPPAAPAPPQTPPAQDAGSGVPAPQPAPPLPDSAPNAENNGGAEPATAPPPPPPVPGGAPF
jgi:hypothetical protein